MSYDLVLCECVCGNRVAYPIKVKTEAVGFVCDNCFQRFRFMENSRPSRVELTDESGERYPMGFLCFSMARCNTDLAEEVVESWFGPDEGEDQLELTGTEA